jgi:magnesium chelatase family protein
MIAKVFSGAILGLEGKLIEIEAEVSFGLRHFSIVGLPDKAVEEARERVKAALARYKFKSPYSHPFKVLLNLAPADLKKVGSLYDLPIALAFLLASQQITFDPLGRVFVGELALDGKLRPVKGALILASTLKEWGFKEIILPKENALEAALIKGIRAIGGENLKEVIDYLTGKKKILPTLTTIEEFLEKGELSFDLAWIKGQSLAKRALEISAAGSHHLLLEGPPGTGKTLLAKTLPSFLPPLSFEEALEVSKIYSLAGLLTPDRPLPSLRPFRQPHHTCSEVALIGGGNPPQPGEITLAHRGVLFLDEFPEFHRDILESLRQPLEEGKITILRARQKITLPAKFILVAAANPCPCGYFGDPEKDCSCTPSQTAKYRRKLSGPLMDRIDLRIMVEPLKSKDFSSSSTESAQIREKVLLAREIQAERLKREKILTNGEMELSHLKKYCQLNSAGQRILDRALDEGKISARGYHRVLKVARTIADLESSSQILPDHLLEALMLKNPEINY